MNIKLLFITKDLNIAIISQKAGIDWIFVDMEYRGKDLRQISRDTVISAHTIEDVKNIRTVVSQSELLVRINPMGPWSFDEIDSVVSAGADIIMLPYFKNAIEVEKFISYVNNRIRTCLLVETISAVENIEDIMNIGGIDHIHVGLNDLHIERGTTFMFEFLSDGSMDVLAERIRNRHIPFGFGGMARIGELVPPAECILAEHYRLGSSSVILSRNFCNTSKSVIYDDLEERIINGVAAIRAEESFLKTKNNEFFVKNKEKVKKDVERVVNKIKYDK